MVKRNKKNSNVKSNIKKSEPKKVKVKLLPIVLSVLAIAIIGFVIYGLQYYSDINKNNINNQDTNYGNLADVNLVLADYNDRVTVNYELTVDGNILESSFDKNSPFTFIVGQGVVKGFSDAVLGMQINEERTVRISPEDGYGTDTTTKMKDMNYGLTALQMYYYQQTGKMEDADKLVGLILYTQDGGQCTFKSYIAEKDIALLSCVTPPHPLAGKVLIFRIKLLAIEKNKDE